VRVIHRDPVDFAVAAPDGLIRLSSILVRPHRVSDPESSGLSTRNYVDLVLDTIGGDTLGRSWDVVRPGGVLVSIAATPSPTEAEAHHVRGVTSIVEPHHKGLLVGGMC
jgi:NADPH:quinone reductase-like Zn-dependent oxidoreductase